MRAILLVIVTASIIGSTYGSAIEQLWRPVVTAFTEISQ